MSNIFYVGTQSDCDIADAQISGNCGLPFGGTSNWSTPKAQYVDPTKWFLKMPDPEGWTREDGTHFTQEEMINGVVNVTPEEAQPDWYPPSPFPPKK